MTNPAPATPASNPELLPKPGIRVKNLQVCESEVWRGQAEHVWIDVESPSREQVGDLERHFAFNKMALEDALEEEHWSRFERYPEHLFLIFVTLAEPEAVTERTEEIDIFWFPEQHALVTFRNEPVTYLEAVWAEMDSFSDRTPMDILYTLLQRGTDTFFAFLDELEDRTEEMERRLFDNPDNNPLPRAPDATKPDKTDPDTTGSGTTGSGTTNSAPGQPLFQEIFALRRTLIATRKRVSSARENVAQFARHAAEPSPEGALYLRDVEDHLTRVYSSLDAAREVLGGLLEVYLSVENQRLNAVIRTLTTVSTIFLPLTFLAGVWGMNFEHEPEFGWRYGYLFAWTCFIAVGGLLLWYFKRKRWW